MIHLNARRIGSILLLIPALASLGYFNTQRPEKDVGKESQLLAALRLRGLSKNKKKDNASPLLFEDEGQDSYDPTNSKGKVVGRLFDFEGEIDIDKEETTTTFIEEEDYDYDYDDDYTYDDDKDEDEQEPDYLYHPENYPDVSFANEDVEEEEECSVRQSKQSKSQPGRQLGGGRDFWEELDLDDLDLDEDELIQAGIENANALIDDFQTVISDSDNLLQSDKDEILSIAGDLKGQLATGK